MANEYYSILTTVGTEKLAQAIITEIPVKLTTIAVGDGNGRFYSPTPDQAQLKRETWRGNINDLRSAEDATNHVLAEGVVPTTVGGWTVREVGLFDDAGDLIAISNYPDTIKPLPTSGSGKQLYVQIHLLIDNIAALELVIDESIVIASKHYVDEKFQSIKDDFSRSDGLGLIGVCPDVATLRNIEPKSPNQQVYVLRNNSKNDVKIRRYYYHQPDTTTTDDNGRVVVTASGKRWKLLFDDGCLTPEIFGAVGDAIFNPLTNIATGTDNTVALQNMLNSASEIGVDIKFLDWKKYLSGSLYLYKDDVLNPGWPSRPGRIHISGMSTGHATGDVENVGAAIIHKPGQATPLISLVGGFSEVTPTGTGGYFQLERLNLVGSPDTSDVLLLQGSQGSIYLANYTVKVVNPAGNGITQSTVWEIAHLNGLIRGGATGDGSWTGIGLNIKADGSNGQTNMSVYTNVNCYKMGYGIRIGRRDKTQGTLGPIVFNGGQTSLADQHGIWLDGGVIAFTSIGQQHEGARLNGIRIDNNIENGVVSSDISRNIKFVNTYITECGRIEDGTGDSYAIYIDNGDGVEFDSPVLNNVGNGIAFNAAHVDNLLIRRPTFRTVRAFGVASGYGIRAFGIQNPVKRQYLERPVFNQSPQTQIDGLSLEIFNRGDIGGRLSFSNPAITTPTIHMGAQTGLEPVKNINFNYQQHVTITNILGGRLGQTLLVTFSNNLCTLKNNHIGFYLNGSDFIPSSNKSNILLVFDGTTWNEINRSYNN